MSVSLAREAACVYAVCISKYLAISVLQQCYDAAVLAGDDIISGFRLRASCNGYFVMIPLIVAVVTAVIVFAVRHVRQNSKQQKQQ